MVEIANEKQRTVYKLRDLTAAYKDLASELLKGESADIEDLSPLAELAGSDEAEE